MEKKRTIEKKNNGEEEQSNGWKMKDRGPKLTSKFWGRIT